jgi:hypothetical protein
LYKYHKIPMVNTLSGIQNQTCVVLVSHSKSLVILQDGRPDHHVQWAKSLATW